MPHPDARLIAERRLEDFRADMADYLIHEADAAIGDFLCFMERKLSKPNLETLLNEWVDTPTGRRWYEKSIDRIFNESLEGPEHDE